MKGSYPEFHLLFGQEGDHEIIVSHNSNTTLIPKKKILVDDINKLIDPSSNSFFKKMNFDEHLFEIQKIEIFPKERKIVIKIQASNGPVQMNDYLDILVWEIIKLYQAAQKSVFPHERVIRVRKHSISSKVEDLFANFLAQNLPSNFSFRIDPKVSFEKIKICPDIVITMEKKILNFIDLKTDLGWKRNEFVAYCSFQNDRMKELQNKCLKINSEVFKVSEKLKYHVVITSDFNISKDKYDEIIEKTKSFQFVSITTLTSGPHPNSGVSSIDEYKKTSRINYAEVKFLFDELIAIS